jgi:hypothetical protein
MAARYCKVCKLPLSVGDMRMRRTAHYHCTSPPVLPISEFCSCPEPQQGNGIHFENFICRTCGKEIRETSLVSFVP